MIKDTAVSQYYVKQYYGTLYTLAILKVKRKFILIRIDLHILSYMLIILGQFVWNKLLAIIGHLESILRANRSKFANKKTKGLK